MNTQVARLLVMVAVLGGAQPALADSVAQVQTAKRIAETTVQLVDPQGGTSMGGAGSSVNYAVGDILTFIIRFTPVQNGATRGLGGYITEYIPPNTEVVGARFIDAAGQTVCPHRGGLAAIGWGPRGAHAFNAANFPTCPAAGCFTGQGGMSSLYADTGIFFSQDTRTRRIVDNQFITTRNGLQMGCTPTGAGQLDDLIGANLGGPYFAHNQWDNVQLRAFGCNGSSVSTNGQGNTPFGYGSAVAGTGAFYPYEATESLVAPGTVGTVGAVGPWQRVRTPCAEIGTGVAATAAGPVADRLGVPTTTGWALSPDAALPAGTNALRFAVGELVVGKEYLAEVSLRVKAAPLDPSMNADVNCSEVFGGDASARDATGANGGKDNTWRYFLPAPACVSLDLLFNLDVDKIQALTGSTLTYTIRAKNLDATKTHTNVVITDDLRAGVGTVAFVSATGGGTLAGTVVTWPPITLAPGQEVIHTVVVTGTGAASPILNRARFVSTQLPAPGFETVALTNLGPLAVIDLAMTAAPIASTAGGNVFYTATIRNSGTGVANVGCAACGVTVMLPPGFTVRAGSVMVNGSAAANPGGTAPTYVFTAGLVNIPPGGSLVITFIADIAAGTAPGVYHSGLSTWLTDPGVGRDINDAIAQVAPVIVDRVQSDIPTVTAPVVQGATMVCGTSSEPTGATIRVYVDLLAVGITTVMGGTWCAMVPTVFAGQNLSATAENMAATELESDRSAAISVLGVAANSACNDTIDNDGDGKIDFPMDPGCTSAGDPDETDVPQCSDTLDNDGDGAFDFPNDPGCSSYVDNTELGGAACGDGVDNDGDGTTDFPADPGCTSAADVSEANVPQCANGIDDDADGRIDYPADPGCMNGADDDEGGPVAPPVDAGVGPMIDAGAGSGDGGSTGDGGLPEWGGVDGGGGCCRTSRSSHDGLIGLIVVVIGLSRRRKPRRAASQVTR